MQALKIVAYMATPVVFFPGRPLNFDGILSSGYYASLSRDEQELLPPEATDPVDFELPLLKWTRSIVKIPHIHHSAYCADNGDIGMVWGWHASAGVAQWGIHQKREVRKRMDLGNLLAWSNDAKIETGAGQFKAQDKAFPTRFATTITFYAFGYLDAVITLLQHVRAIGKLANRGCGTLLLNDDGTPRWEVSVIPNDWSIIGPYGMPMRQMPDPASEAPMLAIRPPYHHPFRRVPCLPFDCESLDYAFAG